MARQLAVPFAIDPLGRVAFVEDPYEQMAQRLEVLIGTQIGTRVMLPDYGVNTVGRLFDTLDAGMVERLTDEIRSAVHAWEPDVIVQNIVTDTEDSTLILTVYFSLAGPDPSTHAATVVVGGSVVDDA